MKFLIRISSPQRETHPLKHESATPSTGSFNFTKSAEERNAENLLVIFDVKLAARYLKNCKEHREHSESYAGR